MKYPLGQKLYFSISEVAEITDLQPYILRTWEKEFTCLRPKRLRGKNRAYRQRDINLILLIKRLLYEERFTIQGVRQKLKNETELVKEAVGQEHPDVPEALDQDLPPDPGEVDGLDVPAAAPFQAADPAPKIGANPPVNQHVLEEVKGQLREILRLLA